MGIEPLVWTTVGSKDELEHVAEVSYGRWRVVQRRSSGRYRLLLNGEKVGADDTVSRLKVRAAAAHAGRFVPEPPQQVADADPPRSPFDEEELVRVTPVEDRDNWPEPAAPDHEAEAVLTEAAYAAAARAAVAETVAADAAAERAVLARMAAERAETAADRVGWAELAEREEEEARKAAAAEVAANLSPPWTGGYTGRAAEWNARAVQARDLAAGSAGVERAAWIADAEEAEFRRDQLLTTGEGQS